MNLNESDKGIKSVAKKDREHFVPGHAEHTLMNFPPSIWHFLQTELKTPVNQFECCPEQRQQVEMYWRVKSGCQCVSKMPWRVLQSVNQSFSRSVSQSVSQSFSESSSQSGDGKILVATGAKGRRTRRLVVRVKGDATSARVQFTFGR